MRADTQTNLNADLAVLLKEFEDVRGKNDLLCDSD
jgi:hypothetical protein